MFRPLELFIGLRYTRAKRRNHFISFISLVSMAGIALGVMALIVVISVMNGFDNELRSRILGMVSHATISGVGESVGDWHEVVRKAEANPRVIGAAPYMEREAMLQADRVAGALVRGILPDQEPKVSEIGNKMVAGKLADLVPGHFGVVLGKELSRKLGVDVGDKVVVYAPEVRVTPVGAVPRVKSFTVVGIFEIGMEEFDAGLAVVHMEDAQRLYQADGPDGVRLKLDDMFRAFGVARSLAVELGGFYHVSDWMQGHSNIFTAIAMEKRVMFMILSLIVAVAAFNLVSTLIMLVTDKQADIAILRTLGASPGSIMGVFMVQGVIVGVIGILIGTVSGVILALNLEQLVKWIEHQFGIAFLSPDVYYISDLPSDMHWDDVGLIAVLGFVFSLLATLYPAWRAARTEPAAALRYE